MGWCSPRSCSRRRWFVGAGAAASGRPASALRFALGAALPLLVCLAWVAVSPATLASGVVPGGRVPRRCLRGARGQRLAGAGRAGPRARVAVRDLRDGAARRCWPPPRRGAGGERWPALSAASAADHASSTWSASWSAAASGTPTWSRWCPTSRCSPRSPPPAGRRSAPSTRFVAALAMVRTLASYAGFARDRLVSPTPSGPWQVGHAISRGRRARRHHRQPLRQRGAGRGVRAALAVPAPLVAADAHPRPRPGRAPLRPQRRPPRRPGWSPCSRSTPGTSTPTAGCGTCCMQRYRLVIPRCGPLIWVRDDTCCGPARPSTAR